MPRPRSSVRRLKKPYGWIYLFLAPTLILYAMYTIWPIVATVWYSLTSMRGFTDRKVTFVGLAQYEMLFKDQQFLNSLKVTGRFLLIVVPIRFLLSLGLALVLNWKKCLWKNFFRTAFFLPVLTTSAVIGVVFILILDPTFGPVNIILRRLGLTELAAYSLLGQQSTALWTTGIIWVWKWLGNSLIYWLASLQSVPDELYEAARIDGANAWQLFKAIMVPLLLPFAGIILILTISDAMKVFNLMLTLTNGGPYFATDTIEVFIYRYAFQLSKTRVAYASAAATVFGVICMVVVILQRGVTAIGRRMGGKE